MAQGVGLRYTCVISGAGSPCRSGPTIRYLPGAPPVEAGSDVSEIRSVEIRQLDSVVAMPHFGCVDTHGPLGQVGKRQRKKCIVIERGRGSFLAGSKLAGLVITVTHYNNKR
jgi:hypothetical protein